ncbi:MAG: hypothetical protein R3249_06690 [Nitriliruptorales bacterium]|nr:hypothetical protein [Nitriliruptorales bacterium]
MDELLQPASDLGVLVQGIVMALVLGALLWLTRRHREWRLVVIGVGMVLIGLFGLRAAH